MVSVTGIVCLKSVVGVGTTVFVVSDSAIVPIGHPSCMRYQLRIPFMRVTESPRLDEGSLIPRPPRHKPTRTPHVEADASTFVTCTTCCPSEGNRSQLVCSDGKLRAMYHCSFVAWWQHFNSFHVVNICALMLIKCRCVLALVLN